MRPIAFTATLASTVLLGMAGSAHAQVQVLPTTYAMQNGQSGTFTYHDETYNGSGNTALDLASLSGGLGDLTNGVMPAQNWNVEEAAANGPYVGWSTVDPLITFNFAAAQQFTEIRIHADDSDTGGVNAPSSVTINGTNYSFAPHDPAGSAPFLSIFNVSPQALNTNQIQMQIFRTGGSWIMVSEVQFFAASSAVAPEPGSLALMGLGAIGLIASSRLRRNR